MGRRGTGALLAPFRSSPFFQMVRITEEAEKVAFRNENFARAVELRWLKTRLLNGPDFQTDDFSRLTALTLELSHSTVMVEEMLQDLGGASTKNLNVPGEYLVIHCRLRIRGRVSRRSEDPLQPKIGVQLRSSGRSAQEIEMDALINLFGTSGRYDARRLMTWLNRCKPEREKVIIKLVFAISRQRDITRMLALASRPKTKGMQRTLELEAIRLACRLSIDLSKWPEFQQFMFHPLSACWALIHRVSNVSLPNHEIPKELLADRYFSLESEQILEDWLHWHFFWCLAKSFIDVAGVFPTVELLKVPWISTALPGLQEAARFAGQRLRRGDRVGFSHIWRFLDNLAGKKEYDDYTVER